jgi:chromosome partitioning protein
MKRRRVMDNMKVVTMITRKGGTGKTTLTGSFGMEAYTAMRESGVEPEIASATIALIDRDPQGDLTDWLGDRGDAGPIMTTALPSQLSIVLLGLEKRGVKLVFVDMPPGYSAHAEESIRWSNRLVIPSGAGEPDLRGVEETIRMARDAGAPYVTVLNKGGFRTRMTGMTFDELESLGGFLPHPVHHRVDISEAVVRGATARELYPRGRAAAEISTLGSALSQKLGLGSSWEGLL